MQYVREGTEYNSNISSDVTGIYMDESAQTRDKGTRLTSSGMQWTA